MKENTGNLCSQNKAKACTCVLGKLLVLTLLICFFWKHGTQAQTAALPTAFAHNDYKHKHPFYDAIKNGFTHMESDIFLHNGRLLVSHHSPYFKGNHTLESLYLKPLLEYFNSRQNSPQ